MTLLTNPIVFSSSGSDTTASGSGGSYVTGQAQFSASTNYANVSNTSGLAVGDLFFCNTSTGRKFNVISLISGSTVYFDNNWDSSEYGINYYVGGERATFDETNSRRIFENDGGSGWKVLTKTDQNLTSAILLKSGSPNYTAEIVGDQVRTITQTANAAVFQVQTGSYGWRFQNLKFQNNYSGGTKTGCYGFDWVSSNSYAFTFTDCEFGDATNSLRIGLRSTGESWVLNLLRCQIHDCQLTGMIQSSGAGSNANIFETIFDNNGQEGINWSGSPDLVLCGSIFSNNGGSGVYSSGRVNSLNSIFYNNGGHGISITGEFNHSTVSNSIFVSNGAYGINTGQNYPVGAVNNCGFFGNTTGTVSKTGTETGSINLSSDPFVDAVNSDFQLNSTAGSGQSLRDVQVDISSTNTFPNLRLTSGGGSGGGGVRSVSLNGGING